MTEMCSLLLFCKNGTKECTKEKQKECDHFEEVGIHVMQKKGGI
jgi:hypothetical protein